MPAIVPTYDLPQVAASALPAARQTTPDRLMAANAIGAEQLVKLGAAGQQLGNTFNDIDVAHQILDNENKTKSTVAGLISEYNAVVHGTPDAEGNPAPDAYLTKSGQGAVDSYDVTQKKLRELKQKALDNMDNEAQRQLARPILDQQYEAFATKVAEHKDRQFKVAGLTSSTTLIAAKADSAPTSLNVITDKKLPVTDLASPEANTPYQHDLRTVINEANHIVDLQNGVYFGRNGGDDAVVRTQMVKSQLEKVYVSVIGHLYASGKAGDGSTQIAKSYFDQVKGELSPAVRDDIEGKLNHATAADNLVTAQLALSGKGGFQAQRDALTEAFKGKDGDVKIGGVRVDGEMYKHLQSDIDYREGKAHQQIELGKARAMGDAQRWVLDQQKAGVATIDVLQMPKALLNSVQAAGGLASLSSFAQRSDSGNITPTPTTDNQYLAVLGRLTANPADYLLGGPRSIVTDMQGLPRQQQAQIMEAYMHVDKDAVKNNVTMQQVNEVTPVLAAAGIIDAKGKKTPEYEPFVGSFQQAVSDWQDTNKRKPTTTDLTAIAKGQLQKVVVASHWYGDDKAAIYAIKPNEVATPQTTSEVQALRKGQTFINPADGKKYVKK